MQREANILYLLINRLNVKCFTLKLALYSRLNNMSYGGIEVDDMIDLSPMLPLINITGFLVLGSAMIFTQWKLGGNQVSGAVIQAYKEQTVLQDKKLTELSHELGVLTGKLLEKDKQITILQAAIAGRDPDSLALGQAAMAFIKRSDEREERMERMLRSLTK